MDQHKAWPHAPLHRFDSHGIYMVTAATIDKRLFFQTPKQLDSLESDLLSLAQKYKWTWKHGLFLVIIIISSPGTSWGRARSISF
jgi:hypothetical protein